MSCPFIMKHRSLINIQSLLLCVGIMTALWHVCVGKSYDAVSTDTTLLSDTTLQSDTTIRSDTTLYFPLRSIKTRICSYCLTQQYGLTQLCLYFPLRPIKTRICSYCLTQQYGLTQLCLYFPLHATVTKKRNVKVLVKKELAGFVLLEVSSHFCYWEFC